MIDKFTCIYVFLNAKLMPMNRYSTWYELEEHTGKGGDDVCYVEQHLKARVVWVEDFWYTKCLNELFFQFAQF